MKLGAFIVPTGIGASIGGFAGDASGWARKFSEKCRLIVNPNVVNAACFSGITDNMLYVEGYSLDEFFRGKCNLQPSKNNKIGVVFDKLIPQKVLNVHINTINAVKTVYGTDIIGFEITEDNVGVEFYVDPSGASMGNVKNLETIKNASQKLIKRGAEALAIVCHFPEDDGEDYAKGIGVDPVGGVEAIISHYISKELKIPCAHAPAFSNIEISTDIVDPRAAAEYITPTFLPCILLGLNNAPKLFTSPQPSPQRRGNDAQFLTIDDLDFLVVPYNSMGGIPVLEMAKHGKKIYAVKENKTVLNVTPKNLTCFNFEDLSHVDLPPRCDIIETYQDLWELI